MLDTLMAGELTFPYYTWSLSNASRLGITNSLDCSYSGSWIDWTYFTFINHSADGSYDPNYEIACANYQHSGGMRAYHKIKWLHADIQGVKFPEADGLTDADPTVFKSYTEWLEWSPVGV